MQFPLPGFSSAGREDSLHAPPASDRQVPRKMHRFAATLLFCAPLGIGCREGTPPGGSRSGELIVFAAASTTDVITRLAEGYGEARVKTSFGPSSGLARQIEDGAPADVYVSASRRWIDHLRSEGALLEPPRVFCRNRLVCIAASGSALAVASAGELAPQLAPGDRVAIADAGVPAGEYARQSLEATGDLEALRGHFVGQDDVRSVLRAVESKEARAGFVYATDARVAEVEELFAFDPATHQPIEYHAAIPVTARSAAAARAFLDHLDSPRAQEILRAAGFAPAD